ncbi:hypothetical protein [Lactococcus cremoris]|uniref:DUF1310 family protein n=2 Tax=Lactococcus lactis subsp. cremoris TaxID=1359 RepID=A0A2A5SY10_LACLC|nr:hypothetical protein [Lactococcus cremoris]KGH34054.1 hypothetical protein JL36_04705 [Lactococcus cremoris]PCS20819.1 hypothetical protein RU92_GL000467 [Lactococcus cremoris subsp. tructae]QSE64011.1 hypothetical protein JWR96_02465 [Lactococcus cremoris]WMX69629.1 hypothetical protein RF668_06910 [Lactococcus cremoris]
MKKRKMLILALLVVGLVGVGITGGKYYMNEKAEKEKVELQTSDYSIHKQKILAKIIKRTFSDVQSITFEKESIFKNHGDGDIVLNANISTSNKQYKIEVLLPDSDNQKNLGAVLGETPEAGKTINQINIVFTNGEEEEI